MFGYTTYAVPQQGLRTAAIGSLGSIYLEVRKSLTILGDPIFYGGTLRSCITVPHQKTESLTVLGDPTCCGGTLRSCITAYPEAGESLTILGGPHGGTPFGADPEEEPIVRVHCPRLWKIETP